MTASQSVPEMVAKALAHVKPSEVSISALRDVLDGQGGSAAQVAEYADATKAIETAAVDVFATFESRMQHHFRRGPFARKLKALMLDSDQPDLAERFHQYYLAVNVLKHGTGASYRELRDNKNTQIVIRAAQTGTETAGESLVDVTVPGFFDGLTTTILDAYAFLENK